MNFGINYANTECPACWFLKILFGLSVRYSFWHSNTVCRMCFTSHFWRSYTVLDKDLIRQMCDTLTFVVYRVSRWSASGICLLCHSSLGGNLVKTKMQADSILFINSLSLHLKIYIWKQLKKLPLHSQCTMNFSALVQHKHSGKQYKSCTMWLISSQ